MIAKKKKGAKDVLENVTERMPFNGNLIMQHASLGACRRTWEILTVARLAFIHATLLGETDVAIS